MFWCNPGVAPSFQALDIREYACGQKLSRALILSQNLNFETASSDNWLSHGC